MVSLTGTGIAPIVALTGINFGNQREGVATVPQDLTVTNSGDDYLTITGGSVGGGNAADFTLFPVTAGQPLLPK